MEYLPLIGTVLLLHLLAVMSPGPDFILTLRQSLTYSRKAGVWTAVGFGLAELVHIFYCVVGLAYIIAQSILLFTIFKVLGGLYLVYIGWQSLRDSSTPVTLTKEKKVQEMTPKKALLTGFIGGVLNPKATLFFLSLFTLVLSPETPLSLIAGLSIAMMLTISTWFALVAVFFTQRRIQRSVHRFQSWMQRIFGALLIGLGIKVVVSQK